MQRRSWLVLLAVLLLAVSCAPPPLTTTPPVTAPATAEATLPPTAAATAAPISAPTATAATPIAQSTPAASATSAPAATAAWQTYTNPDVPLTISYPPSWTLSEAPAQANQPMQGVSLEGPEGRIELQWGSGFGGACLRYSAVHLAQGQVPACHQVRGDGTQQWAQIYKQLEKVSFGANAFTKNAEPASADAVLAVLATLSFGATGALPAPEVGEVIVDNAGPEFWPVGNWYVLNAEQKNGPDCYEALPGLQAYADVRPALSQAGLYEVSVWRCGNPNFNQTARGVIEVHRSPADASPQAVGMNYQAAASQWQSLGVYNLQAGAFLRVRSAIDGNVVADAYRFTAVTGEGASGGEVLPTPLPSNVVVSNHPPSPLEQVASGDLAARLGMTDPWYAPIKINASPATFDDCQVFPREGCTGTRSGYQAVVSLQAMTLTYRVSDDYKLISIQGLDALDPSTIGQEHAQLVFMRGSGGGLDFRVLAYPDNSWHVLRWAPGSPLADDAALTQEQIATLRDLITKYSTVSLDQPAGGNLVLYGLGPSAGPTVADSDALLGLGAAFAAPPTQ